MKYLNQPRMDLYPLTFVPRFVEKIWGGHKLQTVLGKSLPPGKQIGESWELYDFPPGVVEKSPDWISSVIANGPLAGRTLHSLLLERAADLLGDVPPVGPHRQFPLLIKFLDAREDLSVQVHPDAAYAASHPDAHLKNEAWYIVQSDPDSRLFVGLRAGTTRDKFHAAVHAGSVEQHLGTIPVNAGDCLYLPSGTVHALGAGILAAEVQTPSDTTFRVYDFNRVDGSTGKPRTLHVEQAMECIDFADRAIPAAKSSATKTHSGGKVLVESPFFNMTERAAAAGAQLAIAAGKPLILIGLSGAAEIQSAKSPDALELTKGKTIFLPAALQNVTMRVASACTWLHVAALPAYVNVPPRK